MLTVRSELVQDQRPMARNQPPYLRVGFITLALLIVACGGVPSMLLMTSQQSPQPHPSKRPQRLLLFLFRPRLPQSHNRQLRGSIFQKRFLPQVRRKEQWPRLPRLAPQCLGRG